MWCNPAFPFSEDVGGEIAQDFTTRYPNVRFTAENVPGNMVEKLTTAVAGGVPPDLSHVDIYTPASLAASGAIISLENYLKTSRELKKSDLWPTHVADCSYNGQLVAVPFGPDLRVLYIYKNHYDALGLDVTKPPRTWPEFEAVIQRALRRDATGRIEQLGFDPFLGSGGVHRWLVPFWQLGGETLSSDGTRVTIFNDYGIRAMEWIMRIIDMQGGYERVRAFQEGQQANALFINGQVTHYYATYAERAQAFEKQAPQMQFGFTYYPVPQGGRRANYGGGWAMPISQGAKNPDAAWAFLEFFSSDENNLKFANRYDRIPIRIATARSERFTRGDPFRILAAEEMQYRRFVISAPGGAEILPIQATMVNNILQGKQAIRDALREGQDLMQQVLDKYLRK
jgi:multiple sugar transport system substrate-binding protein